MPETTASPSAISSRMITSMLRSAPRRAIAKAAMAAAKTRPTIRIAVSSGGNKSACKITGSTAGRE